MRFRMILFIILFSIPCGAFAKGELSQAMLQKILKDKIKLVQKMGHHTLMIQATRTQNEKAIPLETIKSIDQEWKSTKELTPFKLSLQNSKVGKFLKRKVAPNKSVYSEAFLTDNQGANVAAYPSTSDYWQGDETKWLASFNQGQGKVYIGPIEFDESTQTDAAQVSVPIIDQGKTIGVLIVGVRLSFIEARQLKRLK